MTRTPMVTNEAAAAAAAPADAVVLNNVRVRYPSRAGEVGIDVDDVVIPVGARVAVMGPSGSGKSTLAALIGGFLPPEATVTGEISGAVAGADARVGYIAQDSFGALNPLMRVDEQVALVGDPAVLGAVGLPTDLHHRFPLQLSGGQRQRAAIAFAVASHPQMLIADEVTSALDSVAIVEVLDTLAAVSEGSTLLFLSHHVPAMAYLCDHVISLEPSAQAGVYRAVLRTWEEHERTQAAEEVA
ncbi:ABC transporter ATP-binding protein [Corynebacterium sp. 13CS0277]|uniref:ATP-binding cassette domain-containing protein n=1 Tax=Corynebacterium sp. 13CS0277 TaxID=2071994 RepID=UPI000D0291EF|nr:ATP-binding cassette domain-containing protein [Corynebacterium sp. 13CS0277]PRQ11689.1 ABC transporter ATP-binding protein [Corynebacterium sp. 13CS0277]